MEYINLCSWGPFLEGPAMFSHLETHSEISNLMITELVYSHILNMKRHGHDHDKLSQDRLV